MKRWKLTSQLALLAIIGLLPGTVLGAGFALFEHGARAVAMAGAFGATADDPTAGYYNPAGLAFQKGTQVAFGAYMIDFGSDFTGANPYPGANYAAKQVSQTHVPPHLYLAGDLTNELRWGIAVDTPFGLGTWWSDKFEGRFVTKRTDLKVINFNPNLAYRVGDVLAFAVGADMYITNVDLTKSIGVINPYTQTVAEVGQAHIYTKGQKGWGWNAGVLAKLQGGFSVGLTYRSTVKVDMKGNASFVQFATGYNDFDAIIRSQIPFAKNPSVTTNITFPAEYRAALAWQGEKWTAEFDFQRQGWHTFKNLPITIKGYAALSSVRPENYEDSNSYRLGFEWKKSASLSFEFGGLYDKTPVPTESVSPLLPDADRRGITAGFSYAFTGKTKLDVGYMHLMFPERSTKGLDGDNFNGKYQNRAELLGFTLTHSF
jgi:long-chain fatty acid transport protein